MATGSAPSPAPTASGDPLAASEHEPGGRRLTKIVATVGTPDTPSGNKDALRRLIEAGVSVFRLNFSHGSHDGLTETIRLIRELESECLVPTPGTGINDPSALIKARAGVDPSHAAAGPAGSHHGRGCYPIGVLGDLGGPKIRVGKVKKEGVEVAPGQDVTLQKETIEATERRFSTTWPPLIDDVRIGEKVLINDGAIRMLAVEKRPDKGELVCRVTVGGKITSGKGINLPNTTLRVGAITDKDWADLEWALDHGVDAIALSFVRRADEILTLKRRMRAMARDRNLRPLPVIAKIEKPEALHNIHEILAATDGIMVARGDLGVEMDLAEVPMIQKRLVDLANAYGKPSIVATQMLESMINSPSPTRAEASDVANAILDGTDAVMLSAETAVGRFPAVAVATMGRIARLTEEYEHEDWAAANAAGPAGGASLRRGRLPAMRDRAVGSTAPGVPSLPGGPWRASGGEGGGSALRTAAPAAAPVLTEGDAASALGIGRDMADDGSPAMENGAGNDEAGFGRSGGAEGSGTRGGAGAGPAIVAGGTSRSTAGRVAAGVGGSSGNGGGVSGPSGRHVEVKYRHWMAALAAGTARIAWDVRAEAIVAWSQTGATALELSRCAFRVPIVICSDDRQTLRRITFLRGIIPVEADPPANVHAFTELADRLLLERALVRPGAPIVLVAGHPIGADQKTNSLAVHYVGDPQTGYRRP